MSGNVPVTIFHNPACGTSRRTLVMIEAAGHKPTVIDYLKLGWTRPLLQELLAKMGAGPRQILREKAVSPAQARLLDPDVTDDEILDAMVADPVLVDRPIVITPTGARLCRPAETVLALLDRQSGA